MNTNWVFQIHLALWDRGPDIITIWHFLNAQYYNYKCSNFFHFLWNYTKYILSEFLLFVGHKSTALLQMVSSSGCELKFLCITIISQYIWCIRCLQFHTSYFFLLCPHPISLSIVGFGGSGHGHFLHLDNRKLSWTDSELGSLGYYYLIHSHSVYN